MKKLLHTSIGLLLACFCCSLALAVKVSSLYQAEIPVAAQTDDLKAQAIKEGFLEVLTKLSGDTQIGNNPAIKASLLRPDYYVQELSYSQSTTDSSQYLLKIRYDAADINRLLDKAKVVYWGETRPLILVWLAATNKANTTEIIGDEMPGDLFTAVKQQSKRYGLPLIFPVMDVVDVSHVTPEEVSNVTLPALKEAAKRYLPDALLVGNIRQNAADFQSQWQLIMGKEQWKWDITDKSPDAVIAKVMNQVSQVLAKRSIAKSIDIPELWLKLEVMNITQRDDLSNLLKYLKKLPLVQQVQLLEVSSDVVELSISVRSSFAAFQKNAEAGERLNLKLQDPRNNKLVYVWVH